MLFLIGEQALRKLIAVTSPHQLPPTQLELLYVGHPAWVYGHWGRAIEAGRSVESQINEESCPEASREVALLVCVGNIDEM